MSRFVTDGPHAVYENVDDERQRSLCAANLKRLYGLLKEYDKVHNGLPRAVLLPKRPRCEPSSLLVLLGPDAANALVCPTCSSSLRRFGVNYMWNEDLSGKRLAMILLGHNVFPIADQAARTSVTSGT